MTHLADIQWAPATDRALPPEIEQECRVAIFDLLEENSFSLKSGLAGPYRLQLVPGAGRLAFSVTSSADGADTAEFSLRIGPLKQVLKDYRQICHSYADAVKSASPAQIEAMDEARRAIHIEGARALEEQLAAHVTLDTETARRLFTLLGAIFGSE